MENAVRGFKIIIYFQPTNRVYEFQLTRVFRTQSQRIHRIHSLHESFQSTVKTHRTKLFLSFLPFYSCENPWIMYKKN